MTDTLKPRKPTGFVAMCQCGVAIGALDLERSDRGDVSRLLGRWLMDGCSVHPQFGNKWSSRLETCKCADPATAHQQGSSDD